MYVPYSIASFHTVLVNSSVHFLSPTDQHHRVLDKHIMIALLTSTIRDNLKWTFMLTGPGDMI